MSYSGKLLRRLLVPVLLAATGTSIVGGPANGAAAAPADVLSPVRASTASTPLSAPSPTSAKVSCAAPRSSKFMCLEPARKSAVPRSAAPDVTVNALKPLPQWCYDVAPGTEMVWYLRTEGCMIFERTLVSYEIINGVRVQTGWLGIALFSYTYMSTTSPEWGHQLSVRATGGQGSALGSTVSGTVTPSGSCGLASSTFPSQALPTPSQGAGADGEGTFTSTATAPGAVGTCSTTWNLTFRRADGAAYTTMTHSLLPVRCDNNTVATDTPGCVLPRYPSQLIYSFSNLPNLGWHVYRAQLSGLAGAEMDRPLTRTTKQAIQDLNYSLACGDAPSYEGFSCDEYPPKVTYNGLSAGGTRRTFDSCGYVDIPQSDDPIGASICMIPVAEQSAQGGLHTQFFRRERMLDGDPFLIWIDG